MDTQKIAHTPGPWVARQEFSNRWRIEVPREGFVPISVGLACTTVLEVGCNDKDTAANALLMAASPEMLAALLGIDKALCDGFDTQANRMAARKAMIAVRAAVAKATGA